jgi:hypothetical protein
MCVHVCITITQVKTENIVPGVIVQFIVSATQEAGELLEPAQELRAAWVNENTVNTQNTTNHVLFLEHQSPFHRGYCDYCLLFILYRLYAVIHIYMHIYVHTKHHSDF